MDFDPSFFDHNPPPEPPPWWSSSSSSDDSLQTRVNHLRLLFGIANYVIFSELCDTASSSSSTTKSFKRHRRGCVSFAKKRTVPAPLNVSSDEDDMPSASVGTKDLAGGKRPKTDTAIVVPDKKVVVTEVTKRTVPDPLDVSSDEDDKPSASNGTKDIAGGKWPKTDTAVVIPDKKVVVAEEVMIRSAKMYQEYMKQIPIPAQRGSVITFTSWSGLAESMKHLYQQPLHYLTNVRVKEWDQMRSDADIKAGPLDSIIHPCKAETSIWLMEEVHRLTSSYQFLAKLWLADPMYNACIDSVFPQL